MKCICAIVLGIAIIQTIPVQSTSMVRPSNIYSSASSQAAAYWNGHNGDQMKKNQPQNSNFKQQYDENGVQFSVELGGRKNVQFVPGQSSGVNLNQMSDDALENLINELHKRKSKEKVKEKNYGDGQMANQHAMMYNKDDGNNQHPSSPQAKEEKKRSISFDVDVDTDGDNKPDHKISIDVDSILKNQNKERERDILKGEHDGHMNMNGKIENVRQPDMPVDRETENKQKIKVEKNKKTKNIFFSTTSNTIHHAPALPVSTSPVHIHLPTVPTPIHHVPQHSSPHVYLPSPTAFTNKAVVSQAASSVTSSASSSHIEPTLAHVLAQDNQNGYYRPLNAGPMMSPGQHLPYTHVGMPDVYQPSHSAMAHAQAMMQGGSYAQPPNPYPTASVAHHPYIATTGGVAQHVPAYYQPQMHL